MRASFILLGPLLTPLRPGDHQQPGRRPDRPAAGRPPRRRDAGARRRRSTTATATTSRTAPGRLRGAEVRFPFVSVMGTENAMLAATLADGHTVIRPAAQEPEVDDLIAFLAKMGAEVERTAPDTIEVEGRRRLRGAEHQVVPDRIEAGHVRRRRRPSRAGRSRSRARPATTSARFLDTLGRVGVGSPAARTPSRSTAPRCAAAGYRARDIETAPYPGLATDLQPPTCVLLTQANGTSHVHEAIFEDRLEWLARARQMGAVPSSTTPQHATITGPPRCTAPRSRSATCAPAPR